MLKIITEFIRALHHILFIFPSSPVTCTAVALASLPGSQINGARETLNLFNTRENVNISLYLESLHNPIPCQQPDMKEKGERSRWNTAEAFLKTCLLRSEPLSIISSCSHHRACPCLSCCTRHGVVTDSVLELGVGIVLCSLHNQPKPAHRVWILTAKNRVLMLEWPQHKSTRSATS